MSRDCLGSRDTLHRASSISMGHTWIEDVYEDTLTNEIRESLTYGRQETTSDPKNSMKKTRESARQSL